MELQQVKMVIGNLKNFWGIRNTKFKEWFEFLTLVDLLASKGMETYVSNEPQTFYNMAHYLLTKGELTHYTPVESESPIELDRRAKVNRACKHLWSKIDRQRQLGGMQPFIDDLGFYLLVTGWYSAIGAFTEDGELDVQIRNPANTFPLYQNGDMTACLHSYSLTEEEASLKAQANGWSYSPRGTYTGIVTLSDFYRKDLEGIWHNLILVDDQPVTDWIPRDNILLLTSPVAGFPDRGGLVSGNRWQHTVSRSIFEVNKGVTMAYNKWRSMLSQILRDTAQPITQEFSAQAQATPEQLRERGGHFHYSPGEQGLHRVPPPALPLELTSNLMDLRKEMQKGSFSDAVYGMVENQAGYAMSIMATSSANQILYPYMQGKHFVIEEFDRFWLSKLKTTRKTFAIKGYFNEKLVSKDIPEEVVINVESDVATPKDWLERGTIANMLKEHLDEATIITEVLKLPDPQAIKRKRSLDKILSHPMTLNIEMIAGYNAHADYLDSMGDTKQADLFRGAAASLQGQLGSPPQGEGRPEEYSRIMAERQAGSPDKKQRVRADVLPPEERGAVTPQEGRTMFGSGQLRR